MIGARHGAKGLAKEEKRVGALRKALRSRSKELTELGTATKAEAKKRTSRMELGVLGGSGVAIGGAGAYAGSREPETRG
jgi:hypothetical protein